MADKFYAVKKGKTPGIYLTWDDCKSQVEGFTGAKYKSFKTYDEAADFAGIDTGYEQISLFDLPSDSKAIVKKKAKEKTTSEPPFSDLNNAVAYVDGSYNVATKKFSYGIVMFYDNQEIHISEMVDDEELAEMRNVAGEIKGAEAAMHFAYSKNCKNLTIYHDYEGISKWCLGLWKTNKSGTKAYKQFYDGIKLNLNVTFIKVKGHSGDKYNELADQLAKQAIFN